MTVRRREALATLGTASAATLLWAFGCGSHTPPLRRAPQVSRDVRAWLRDAVARLAPRHPTVHALAVSRRRTAVALDVLGPGAAHLRADGAVLTVRGPAGPAREYVTSELTAASLDAAATALGGSAQRAALDFGPAPPTPDEPPALDAADLRRRVEQLLAADAHLSSRIVYAAAALDIDDAIVWSVAAGSAVPGRDLEQRLVRIRQSVARAAWNGSRPVVATAERAWSGWLDDDALVPADVTAASEAALKLMTPGSFPDGERPLVLDPSVAALLLDAAAQRLTTAGGTIPVEHALPFGGSSSGATLAVGASVASAAVTLVDDPTAPHAYGGFAFDDQGEPAASLTLLDAGRVAAHLGPGRGRRPGHLAPVEPSPSHLVLRPGTAATAELYSDGFVLEAGLAASYDPASDRIRIACARARELRAGSTTGRIYADVELTGSLAALLAAIDAVARDPISIALPTGAAPFAARWRSIATPAVRTRGFVRARRSRA